MYTVPHATEIIKKKKKKSRDKPAQNKKWWNWVLPTMGKFNVQTKLDQGCSKQVCMQTSHSRLKPQDVSPVHSHHTHHSYRKHV